MKIRMNGLYGMDNHEAYYRKNGDCFDFCRTIENATELTEEEVNKIFEHKEWYLKCYNAKDMIAF